MCDVSLGHAVFAVRAILGSIALADQERAFWQRVRVWTMCHGRRVPRVIELGIRSAKIIRAAEHAQGAYRTFQASAAVEAVRNVWGSRRRAARNAHRAAVARNVHRAAVARNARARSAATRLLSTAVGCRRAACRACQDGARATSSSLLRAPARGLLRLSTIARRYPIEAGVLDAPASIHRKQGCDARSRESRKAAQPHGTLFPHCWMPLTCEPIHQ